MNPANTGIVVIALLGSLHAPSVSGQQLSSTRSEGDSARVIRDVQRQLLGLTDYGVFDWLTFETRGNSIILHGYASRPILREDAGRVVKQVQGVGSVVNQIEVLPLSPSDDRIRASVYNRIYTQPALSKYNANQGSWAHALGPGGRWSALMAGGITNNPPLGFHAIHIVVKRGNVLLFGAVLSSSDAAMAGIMANGTPGTFSVTNNIASEAAPDGSAK